MIDSDELAEAQPSILLASGLSLLCIAGMVVLGWWAVWR